MAERDTWKRTVSLSKSVNFMGGILWLIITPRLIPDGIVEKIWEGTITVLSLDLVRATDKSAAMDAFVKVS